MCQDPLHCLPIERWTELQEAFKLDWPRGISGYTALKTQKKWNQLGIDYGFKVYCPFGEVRNGMVAINEKNDFYEIIIQCPTKNTENLGVALRKTSVINWKRAIVVPFAPYHVIECLKGVTADIGVEIELILPSNTFILNRKTLFEDITLPPGMTFGPLTPDHIELVDSTWPHRYPNSSWYFQLLISANSGYGLFLDNVPITWVFVNESGTFLHMFTKPEQRQKGYAELLMKLVSNILVKEDREVFAFCVKGNVGAQKLYRKVGFEEFEDIAWCYLKCKC